MGIFNPYHMWLMVVFVSGIGFIGYFLTKIVWSKKGIWLTGLIWWLVSSTAVTTSLSQLSKKTKNMSPFVFWVLISSIIMFIRVGIEIFSFNRELFWKASIPLWVMATTGLLIAAIFFFRNKKADTSKSRWPEIKVGSPFAIKPALFFAGFFALVIAASKISLHYFGDESLYIISILSALADVDAITLSIASLDIPTQTAVIAIVLAAITNTLVKGWITYVFWERKGAYEEDSYA